METTNQGICGSCGFGPGMRTGEVHRYAVNEDESKGIEQGIYTLCDDCANTSGMAETVREGLIDD